MLHVGLAIGIVIEVKTDDVHETFFIRLNLSFVMALFSYSLIIEEASMFMKESFLIFITTSVNL